MKLDGKPIFDPKSDPYAHYRILGGALALLMIGLAAISLWHNWKSPVSHDFIAYWGAAKLAAEGHAALAYDPDVLHRVQTASAEFGNGGNLPFGYMPAFLLPMLPFSLLPYGLAMIIWVCATLVLYLVALKQLVPKAGLLALAFPAVFVNCDIGQNGLLTGAVLFATMALLSRRPFVAGLLAGCLIVKPQLAMLLPLVFLAGCHWRAFAGAAVSSITITAAGLVAFGGSVFIAWIEALPSFGKIAKDGTVGWIHFTSVYAAGRQAGLDAGSAIALHLLVAAMAAALAWRVWRSSNDVLQRASAFACATALSSPYLFLYDQVILIIAFFWLAQKKVSPFILAPVWCLPIISIAQYGGYTGPVNFGPVVPIVLCSLIAWQFIRDDSEETFTAAARPLANL